MGRMFNGGVLWLRHGARVTLTPLDPFGRNTRSLSILTVRLIVDLG